MAQELRAEELRHAADRYITSATSADGQHRTTNKAICKEFRQYLPGNPDWALLSSTPISPTSLASRRLGMRVA